VSEKNIGSVGINSQRGNLRLFSVISIVYELKGQFESTLVETVVHLSDQGQIDLLAFINMPVPVGEHLVVRQRLETDRYVHYSIG
jgi:hypothetical protein